MPEGGNIPPDPNNPGGRAANQNSDSRLLDRAAALMAELSAVFAALADNARERGSA